ncbi:hypothetical protein [Mycobacterium sp. MMS18-G62]
MSRRSPAHARSRKAEDKKARRRKRQAAQGSRWLPDNVLDELVSTQATIATDLEAFDQRITERGWTFDEDESDEDFVFWYYEPSGAQVAGDEVAPVTTVWMSADEDAQIVHVMFVGTTDDGEFTPDALFEHIEAIEAYRVGDPVPEFDHS